ncbi:MAG: ammonium transporter, partial [Bacteroidetes bacterium QS_4_64_154]
MASQAISPQKVTISGMRIPTSLLFVVGLLLAPFGADALAASDPSNVAEAMQSAEQAQTNLNYVWTIIAAAMVFFMQAGFALLESGFSRAKNAVNIIMKNVMDASAGALVFFAVGFGLMFGTS